MAKRCPRLGSVCLTLLALAPWPAVPAETEPYHILLTNDDGIESPGIQLLAGELRRVGRVHLVAPCGQRSGASMSIALRQQLQLRTVERDGASLGRCVDTTPAGAV